MAGTLKRLAGPAYLASTATNIYTPAASTIVTVLRHIHIANKTGGAVTFTLYIGLTGGSLAGSELFATKSVLANDVYDWYASPGTLMTSADFLSGLASAATSLTITVMGEQYVV